MMEIIISNNNNSNTYNNKNHNSHNNLNNNQIKLKINKIKGIIIKNKNNIRNKRKNKTNS